MWINLTNDEVKNFKDIFINKLIDKGINLNTINEKQWNIEGTEIFILKGIGFFEYMKEKYINTSIKPLFSIVDEDRKEITMILPRAQETSGSTDQKLPYGNFMIKDYIRLYNYVSDYDIKVAFVLSDFFNDPRYIELKKYLKMNSISVWVNKVKV